MPTERAALFCRNSQLKLARSPPRLLSCADDWAIATRHLAPTPDNYHLRRCSSEHGGKHFMARVMVYPFEVYNINLGEYILCPRMGTLERIQAIAKASGAKPYLDRGIEIDQSQLDAYAPGLTAQDFQP